MKINSGILCPRRRIERHGKLKRSPMRQSSCPRPDPIEREIEVALRPRAFIRDGECFSLVSGLEAVASRIEQLIETDPKRYESSSS